MTGRSAWRPPAPKLAKKRRYRCPPGLCPCRQPCCSPRLPLPLGIRSLWGLPQLACVLPRFLSFKPAFPALQASGAVFAATYQPAFGGVPPKPEAVPAVVRADGGEATKPGRVSPAQRGTATSTQLDSPGSDPLSQSETDPNPTSDTGSSTAEGTCAAALSALRVGACREGQGFDFLHAAPSIAVPTPHPHTRCCPHCAVVSSSPQSPQYHQSA